MKSFLLNSNYKPILQWGKIPNNVFYEGEVPQGFFKAVCPGKYIVLDVDNKSPENNGFNYIPMSILSELENTFNYKTKSGKGRHYWLLYLGGKILMNTSTKYFLDLRVGERPGNCGGYVLYHHPIDIRQCIHLIKETSPKLNKWLESHFLGVNYIENEE